MADTLTTRKLLGQLLVGVLIVIGLAVVGTLLSLFALNHFGGIQGLEAWRQSNYWSLFAWRAPAVLRPGHRLVPAQAAQGTERA